MPTKFQRPGKGKTAGEIIFILWRHALKRFEILEWGHLHTSIVTRSIAEIMYEPSFTKYTLTKNK